MLILHLQSLPCFSFPQFLNPKPHSHHRLRIISSPSPPNCFYSDEFPVDEAFIQKFAPKDKETEDEARRKNWVDRGWAPWEEVLTPEADFARKSLNEGYEVPLKTPEAIEAFKALSPKYRKQKMEDLGLTEDDWYRHQFAIKDDFIPDKLETSWTGPLLVSHVPPRDWPPRGWQVDRAELEFIREAHKLQSERLSLDDLEAAATVDKDQLDFDRYKVFLKQYNEWVDANKDRLEQESYEQDQDYYPGRRKRGKDYKDGMYELPFYYPGQICEGKVVALTLYQGAFVDIGGVHDGWVPIRNNDWFWIRHHIEVGMHVIVEILAKRDPYRFRYPIEMRFIFPNIDHMIFNRFEFPPIFHRDEDTNQEELLRDCGRPPVPRKDPETKSQEEALLSYHPYVDKLWQIHAAEQMIVDDWVKNPEKYKGKKIGELSDDEDINEENSVVYGEAYHKNTKIPKMTVKTSVKELDLEAALAEHEHHSKLRMEAKARGEKYKIEKLRRNIEMDEYDLLHWRRSVEEREALLRDISCRQATGLPLEEPGRYKPESFFGNQGYDPDNPLYRYDYWGEPKSSEKSKQARAMEAHNKSIVGKGTVWYEKSYEDVVKEKFVRKKASSTIKQEEVTYDEEEEDDEEWDYSFLYDSDANSSSEESVVVNGTETSGVSEEGGMFENSA
ncbi:Protein PLASTID TRANSCRIPTIONALLY ACTIVE 10 [Linum grandiflorum]